MNSFNILEKESKRILNSIPELISRTFPIPGKFRGALPYDIAELSKLLTNSRGERSLSYLSRPNFLSAYLYYYLPWNLYRLCVLLPSINLKLSEGDLIIDLGCGPLTFVSALWISRPDLRVIPLEFNCIDRAGPVLEAGKKFFTALCEFTGNDVSRAWKINLIKKDININKSASLSDAAGKKKAALVCAVNMFNEHYDRISHNDGSALRNLAKTSALFMHAEAAQSASILTVEPGVPQSGKFISFLREAFIDLGRMPSAPCTHSADCPLFPAKKQTKKERWCHFAFETADAPKDLIRLSAAAKLQKDRLVFSFLYTEEGKCAGAAKAACTAKAVGAQPISRRQPDELPAAFSAVRVISDAFPLPGGRFGRYACSAQGLVLVTGEKDLIEKTGSLSVIPEKGKHSSIRINVTGERDVKSGAIIMELK